MDQVIKKIGEQTEAILIAKLLEASYIVLTPFGDSARYDIVIEDDDGKFWKIQCKTGWLDQDSTVIRFNSASTYAHTRKGQKAGFGRRGYAGEVDYFAVYCPETKRSYLVPVDHVNETHPLLRLVPPANRQKKGVRMEEEYEI